MANLATSRTLREISRACVLMLIAPCTLALAVAQPVKDVGSVKTGAPKMKLAPRPTGLQSLADVGASASAQSVVHWILDTGDHQQLPFAVVDKIHARVFVFHRTGRLLGSAPVLLGQALGDEGVAGVGERPLSQIPPEARITPSGRFVAQLDRNVAGQSIMWVDYEQAISMHPVRSHNPQERRLERLASPTVQDNRITYGCINVPTLFWRTVIAPAFRGTRGIVYILPDSHPLVSVFAVARPAGKRAATK